MNEQTTKRLNVGGQAVLEGVMMRSPHSLAIAVRRPSGEIVLREDPWRSLWEKLRFLRWPFFRGTVVLIESLVNGIQALSFSANQALVEEDEKGPEDQAKPGAQTQTAAKPPAAALGQPVLSNLALGATIAVSFAFGLLLFVGLPHLATWLLGKAVGIPLDVDSFWFHAIDGAIKLLVFVGYVWFIGRMPEIKRVFEYHGAEHKSIFAYESGLDLTVANALRQPRLHPRCGTSFLIVVLIVSIVVFALVFPYVPKWTSIGIVNQFLNIGLKILFMMPIAGVAYEFIKLSARWPNAALVRLLVAPGLWTQRITTREPDEKQIEVALAALKLVLWREGLPEHGTVAAGGEVRLFANLAEIEVSLQAGVEQPLPSGAREG